VAVVAVVLLWRGCGSNGADRPPTKPGEFAADGITFTSPDLDLQLFAVRATAHPGYTDWACLLECRERGGCGADVRIRLVYVAAGDERTLMMSGRLEAARGETIRIGRVQRPPTQVDRVKAVIVEVVAPYTPGAARPTPVQ
jgi:hypothetical protein